MAVCGIGAPQGTVLSAFLFTVYTSDFSYNTETCHLQKLSDDRASVGCTKGGREEEYRDLVECSVEWSSKNQLHLNISKAREMAVNFRRPRSFSVCRECSTSL